MEPIMTPEQLYNVCLIVGIGFLLLVVRFVFLAPYLIYARSGGAEKGCFLFLLLFFGLTGIGWFILLLVALNEANRRRL